MKGDGWWSISTPRMTFAVKVSNNVIVEAAPIAHRFIGQPATNLGRWVRQQGEAEFVRLATYEYTYQWGNNEKRATLRGRPCRVVARGAMRSVLIEFPGGQHEVVSYRALRKENR